MDSSMASTHAKHKETEMLNLDDHHLEKGQMILHEETLAAAHETVVVDETIVERIVRKCDLHLLILLVCINIFNFIDRGNIGNARILGMQHDLKLDGLRYNIAVMCLFISSVVVEVPSNIVCKKVGAGIWIPFLVFVFGLITTLVSLTQSAGGLYAARFMLGWFEGGVSPGIVWLLSQFYRRSELGLRTSIYISAAGSSGAFGGLFAIGLSKIPRWGLIHTWRNIYFFEGLISIVLAVVGWFVIPDGPQTAKFLTEEERVTAVNRSRVDAAGTDEGGHTKMKHILQALKSPHVLGCSIGFLMGNVAQNALAVFTPSIINGFGYSPTSSQLLSVGPYAVACVLSIFLGWLSDHYKSRSLVIICCATVAIAGFFMLEFLPANRPWAKYGAVYVALPALYSSLPIWMTWCVNNCATATVRASASGALFAIGSMSGIVAPWVYLSKDAPSYHPGHAILIAMVFGSWTTAIILRLYCQWENCQRDLGKRDHILSGLTQMQELELSSKHPSFRYII